MNENDEIIDNQDEPIETAEPEFEEFEVPDYITDDLIPPDEFEDDISKVIWYEENYLKLINHIESEPVRNHIKSKYQEEILTADKEYNKLKAVKNLMEGNPEEYIKLYAPDYLVKNRINAGYGNEEKATIVDKQLKKEFGEDYRELYDEEKANIKGTMSNRMFEKQQQLLESIDKHNEEVNQKMNTIAPTKEQIEQTLKQHYEMDFKDNDWTEEEFKEFSEIAIDYAKQDNLTIGDIHRIMYFDEYQKDAYSRGLKDGKKGIVQDISKLHNSNVKHQPIKRDTQEIKEYNKFGSFGKPSIVDKIKINGG